MGIEPTPDGLKVSHAACYTTTPIGKAAEAFMPMQSTQHFSLLQINASIKLVITTSRVVRTRTEILLLPEQAMLPLAPLPDFKQSERQDSNLRSPGPRPGAMTKLRYVLKLNANQKPRTLSAVGWEVLEPSSAALQATATPSQLPAPYQKRGQVQFSPRYEKSPLSADTGLTKRLCKKVPQRRQKRLGCMGR